MMISLSVAISLALQSAPVAAPPASGGETQSAPIASLDELPIEQATGPRCAIAFALVSRWQKSGDPRGADYADLEADGGREFFVQAMAVLMDATGMTREQVSALTFYEVGQLDNPDGEQRLAAMMPACLLLKQSAGL